MQPSGSLDFEQGGHLTVALLTGQFIRPGRQNRLAWLLLVPEFCPGGPRLTCGPTLSTNRMRPWD